MTTDHDGQPDRGMNGSGATHNDPLARLPHDGTWALGGAASNGDDDGHVGVVLGEGGLLTPGQVARLFGVDPKTVSRWGQQGRLPMRKTLGGHRRFPAEEVYALLEETRGRREP